MIHITTESAYKDLRVKRLLQKATEKTLNHAGNENSDVSIVLTGDKKLKGLNRQFRGIDQATDVLSFPADPPEKGLPYLGDVIISVERAKAQAKEAGHSVNDELALLTVHGVLHLLGHDHHETIAKRKMWAAQNKILQELGINLDVDAAISAYSQY